MRPRTLARRLALQYLYMIDCNGDGNVEPHAEFVAEHADDEEARAFASELIRAVLANRQEIDALLVSAAANWQLDRIAVVERNALRIGCVELKLRISPPGVAINEAVRMAKTFGGKDSGGFVNGILDRIREMLCLQQEAGDE